MPTYGEIDALVLDAIDVPELVHLIEVNIAKGKAHLTLSQGVDAADAYQNALDVSDSHKFLFEFCSLINRTTPTHLSINAIKDT
jgi:hypothetical protein